MKNSIDTRNPPTISKELMLPHTISNIINCFKRSLFFHRVKIALQGRKLRYVRLIGPGSMHAHTNHDLYEEDIVGKASREAFLYFPEVYKKKSNKASQIRAVYQFAVQLLVR